eukprot:8092282-Heterocapsa_arctica.AAC.1
MRLVAPLEAAEADFVDGPALIDELDADAEDLGLEAEDRGGVVELVVGLDVGGVRLVPIVGTSSSISTGPR